MKLEAIGVSRELRGGWKKPVKRRVLSLSSPRKRMQLKFCNHRVIWGGDEKVVKMLADDDVETGESFLISVKGRLAAEWNCSEKQPSAMKKDCTLLQSSGWVQLVKGAPRRPLKMQV